MMNILECQELFLHPLIYGTFLLWMLSELYEMLPEAGDLDKPKLVFFFDEAHLLFKDAPKALVEKVEQVIRLIRSKGVSVWFITQNPSDIPDSVLGQLGNRVQHALRAYTPNEQKFVKAAAKSFRENPAFDTEEAIMALAVGEALVSLLDADGIPAIVERANILPPRSSMAAVEGYSIQSVIEKSPLKEKYGTTVDEESAYEILRGEAEEAAEEARLASEALKAEKERKEQEKIQKAQEKEEERKKKEKERRFKNSIVGKVANSAVNTIGREVGRKLVRGILGSLLK
jgi:DNA helicase HerA-like ATPase